MKKIIILFILFNFITFNQCYAMKVVKNTITEEFVYTSVPEFEQGMGIANALFLWGGSADDYEEVEITTQQWDDYWSEKEQQKQLKKDRVKTKLGISDDDIEDLKAILK